MIYSMLPSAWRINSYLTGALVGAREKPYLIRYGPGKISSESLEPIELRYITE
jgi:hypothetical protein